MVQVSRGKLKQMEKQLEQAAADSERLAVTEAQLVNANEEKVRLSDEIERKKAEVNKLTGTNETLNEQVDALRNELKQLNTQLLEVIKQIEQHEVNIGQLRSDANQLLDDNEQLKAANTVTNQQLAQATKQLDHINAENAVLTTELKSSKENGVKMSEQKEHLSRRLMVRVFCALYILLMSHLLTSQARGRHSPREHARPNSRLSWTACNRSCAWQMTKLAIWSTVSYISKKSKM